MFIKILISAIFAGIGLVVSNWLALILYVGLLALVPSRSKLVSTYLSRISMGLMVGILFAIMDYYFNLDNSTLTTIFLLWAIFYSEPLSTSNSAHSLIHDVLRGDVVKYHYHKRWLKVARIVAYFIAKLSLFALFLYLSK